MRRFLVVAAGGAIGTVCRYIVSGIEYRFSYGSFPTGTFVVNATGALVIGFLWGITHRFNFSPDLCLFIFIGVLGGYTTFSTFGLENFHLFRNGEYIIAIANICITNIAVIISVFAGFFAARWIACFQK